MEKYILLVCDFTLAKKYLKIQNKKVSYQIEKSKWNDIKDKLTVVGDWAKDRLTNEQITENLGVEKTTFYKMLSEYSELSELLKKGKEIIDYEVENALLKNALDENVTAQIYQLNIRKPKQWKNKRENTKIIRKEYQKLKKYQLKLKKKRKKILNKTNKGVKEYEKNI